MKQQMKMNHNSIVSDLTSCNRELSFLVTEAEYGVEWHSVPNAKLEIINDRVRLLKVCLDEIFQILQEHEKS